MNKQEETIKNKLYEIMSSICDEQIDFDTFEEYDLIDDLYFDSIRIIELIISIEDAFNLTFDAFDFYITSFKSCKQLLCKINEKINATDSKGIL